MVRGVDLASRPWLEHLAFVPTEATTTGRWVDSCDVRVGDEVLLRDGRIVTVDRMAFGPFEGTVYNMEVEELQCYTVGKVSALVHNNNGAEMVGERKKSGKGGTEHRKKRPSTREKHEKGDARRDRSKDGEKGDQRRPFQR